MRRSAFIGAVIVVALLIVATATVSLPASSKSTPLRCTGSGSTNVLIIGDSWASHLEIGHGFYEEAIRHGMRSRVCQISYPGTTLGHILDSYRKNDAPDIVIVIAGLNDAAGHWGVERYGKSVRRIGSAFQHSRVFVLDVPRYSESAANRTVMQIVGHCIRACLRDACAWNTFDDYRRALADNSGRAAVISFDSFIPSYADHQRDYTDGMHLIPEKYHALGVYFARSLNQSHQK